MEFIENNEKYGIKYDLSKIAKEYKKLKIPKEFDFVDFNRIENNSYIIDLSQRSVGKTTCYLLLSYQNFHGYTLYVCHIICYTPTLVANSKLFFRQNVDLNL